MANRIDQPLRVESAMYANRVFLAPLSGITDVPFRRLARRFGAGAVVSEMVASGEFVRGDRESALRAMRDGDGLHVVQLAGRDPLWMRAAAERLVDLGADVIDINMGCPAKKVVGGASGSALMREPDLALQLIEATVAGAGAVPVTLKMRLGWDRRSINAPALAARAEAAGVRLVTVHGRTRDQFYQGQADWPAIAAVRAAISIPLVANGDLVERGQTAAMLEASRADAVMIGRGACGRPWFPGLLAGVVDESQLATVRLADLVCEHYEAMLVHYGAATGVRHARKHLAAYCERFAVATNGDLSRDRTTMLTSTELPEVLRTVRATFSDCTVADMEAAPFLRVPRKAA
ncbi:tRNA dihydrouridine synthase [Consotaella aegiceratis]|uniref:tRNA dihydrouridine synthase n=1 Tax=Consotaella aegiceratis TaxID=3097961 RepID=UPI002F3E9496